MTYNKKQLNNILKNGGVIAYVTDTVWGIGCLPDNKKAVDKIYEIKGRDRSKPLILMSNEIENLIPYVQEIPPTAKNLISRFFPGALTLVLKKAEKKRPKTLFPRNPELRKFLLQCIDQHAAGGEDIFAS